VIESFLFLYRTIFSASLDASDRIIYIFPSCGFELRPLFGQVRIFTARQRKVFLYDAPDLSLPPLGVVLPEVDSGRNWRVSVEPLPFWLVTLYSARWLGDLLLITHSMFS